MGAANSPQNLALSQQPAGLGIACDAAPLTREICENLKDEWSELAAEASEGNIFLFPGFISNSLVLLKKHAPMVVTVRNKGVLIGLVILKRDLGYAKLPLPFWRSALHPEQYLGAPLVRGGDEKAFAIGLCRWLDAAPRSCSFAKLSMIDADGPLAAALQSYCAENGRRILIANKFERAAIVPRDSESTGPDALLSPARRKSIRRSMKKLSQQGLVSFDHLKDPEEVAEWTAQFLAMEDTGWKHEAGSSILSCEHETALYKAAIKDAFAAGNLHFSRLSVDQRPIAFTLDIAAKPFGFCLKSAIDQEFRKFSPGVLMEFETLKHYAANTDFTLVDSCSDPDNAMLNEMWPARRQIMDIAIARKGGAYGLVFRCIIAVKSMLGSGANSGLAPDLGA
jgi:hypothetical protein